MNFLCVHVEFALQRSTAAGGATARPASRLRKHDFYIYIFCLSAAKQCELVVIVLSCSLISGFSTLCLPPTNLAPPVQTHPTLWLNSMFSEKYRTNCLIYIVCKYMYIVNIYLLKRNNLRNFNGIYCKTDFLLLEIFEWFYFKNKCLCATRISQYLYLYIPKAANISIE